MATDAGEGGGAAAAASPVAHSPEGEHAAVEVAAGGALILGRDQVPHAGRTTATGGRFPVSAPTSGGARGSSWPGKVSTPLPGVLF